jgi:tetratricopeptide (TPR) repeat protein
MFLKFFKLVLIIILFYQNPLYSKTKVLNDFNSQHLSDYFSGIVAYQNKKNLDALKFFKSSKNLINTHDPYLKRYIYTLVLENKVQKATNEIKNNLTKNNSNFFEAYLLLAINSLKEKEFKKSKDYLKKSSKFIDNDRITLIIYETIKQYIYVFEENKILKAKKNFGKISFINEVFQRCYLGDENTKIYFENLINNENDTNYSRYVFFKINYLIENNRFKEVKQIANKLDYLDSTILVSQSKKWVEKKKLDEFKKIFSCTNSNDIVSEFLFLVANLYSSQNDFEKSNFYLNLSRYLNPKFKFNLTLLAENYYTNKNYLMTKKILTYFNSKDEFYYWFKLKKQTQMISKEFNDKKALRFINLEFKKIKDPSIRIMFDIANFNKNSERYQNAIDYYYEIISKIDSNSTFYPEILYRRGASYERLGNYLNSDKDLLKSLEINPNDAYVLNYLAYSWLERDYKIDIALQMLEKAYAINSDDPYIIDSIGWAYYLVDNFLKAEKFLKRAVELMPDDPVVNDHYGDILWKLDRKIQARYFWANVLNLEETEDKMKKNINLKLIEGLKAS